MAQFGKVLVINILVILGLLFLIEGFLGYVTIGQVFFKQKIAERQHTEYDEELGWINLPNVHIEDMYSREDPLTINSQRYRSTYDFSPRVAAGRTRIICAGDSFTLGFGVDDEHTWCQQLTALDPQLETVNMGQGGYGVDQAWLWYRRDEGKLEHDVVLFAFISEDFTRMESDTFMGYGKPFLTLRDGKLEQQNYPVPRRSYDLSWWQVNLPMWRQLHTVKFFGDRLGGLLPRDPATLQRREHGMTDQVVARIFADLEQLSRDRHRLAVLVYLPTRNDASPHDDNRWRRLVWALARERGYPLIDVAQAMQQLPPEEIDALFRKGGHYTDAGNLFVARVILERLRELLPTAPASAPEPLSTR